MDTMKFLEKAVGFSITIGKPGVKWRVDSERVLVRDDEDVDLSRLKVTKAILKSREYDEVSSLDNLFRRKLSNIALPSLFRRGIWVIPMGLVERVVEMVNAFRENRKGLVNVLMDVYQEKKEEARRDLGTLYNEKDYPDPSVFRRAFNVDYRFIEFGVPGKLETISSELFEKQRERAERQWGDAMEEIRQVLRLSLKEIVDHMSEKLGAKTKDGKPKVIRDSSAQKMIRDLREFVEVFKPRNITEDSDLEELVDRCKNLMNGRVTPEALQENMDLRRTVEGSIGAIKEKLDTLVVERPSRRISFDEDE